MSWDFLEEAAEILEKANCPFIIAVGCPNTSTGRVKVNGDLKDLEMLHVVIEDIMDDLYDQYDTDI